VKRSFHACGVIQGVRTTNGSYSGPRVRHHEIEAKSLVDVGGVSSAVGSGVYSFQWTLNC
jgi:hypothetical protein